MKPTLLATFSIVYGVCTISIVSARNIEVQCPEIHEGATCIDTSYEPICEVHHGRTFANQCSMFKELCVYRFGQTTGRLNLTAYEGTCEGDCHIDCRDVARDPVCSSDCISYPNQCEFDVAHCEARLQHEHLFPSKCTRLWARSCHRSYW